MSIALPLRAQLVSRELALPLPGVTATLELLESGGREYAAALPTEPRCSDVVFG